MGLPWLGRRIVATLMGRSRPVGDAVGTLVLSGLAAVMIGLTALYEILLLSDANATLLIGGPHRSVLPSPSSPHPWRPCRRRARRAHGCADRPGTAVSGWDQAVPGAPGHGARSDDAVAAWAAYWTILPIPGIRWPEGRSRRRLSCSKCRLRHGIDLLRAVRARHAWEEVG